MRAFTASLLSKSIPSESKVILSSDIVWGIHIIASKYFSIKFSIFALVNHLILSNYNFLKRTSGILLNCILFIFLLMPILHISSP